MRKIFSLIAIMCIGGAFATARTHQLAPDNAAESAPLFNASTVPEVNSDSEDESDYDADQLENFKEECNQELLDKYFSTNPDIMRVIYEAVDDILDAESKKQVIQIRDFAMVKADALIAIDAYKEGKTFTKEEEKWLDEFTSTILNAKDTDTINKARDNALGIYALRDIKSQAISAINDVIKEESGSAYLNSIATDGVEAIKSANTAEVVNTRKTETIWKLETALKMYKEIRSDLFGTLATPQAGPAIEVTDQNDKVIILYNPKNAKLIEQK